jgi:hypothetical protein
MKKQLNMSNLKNAAAFVASILLAYGMAQGTVQNYIHFNDVLGEIGVFVMALTATVITGGVLVSDLIKNVRN